MLFAAGLELEREPPIWDSLPLTLVNWVQYAGTFAAIGLVIWAIATLLNRTSSKTSPRMTLFEILASVACVLSVIFFVIFFIVWGAQGMIQTPDGPVLTDTQNTLYFLFAFFPLLAVAFPVLYDLIFKISFRRVWAIALLSIKEAIRGRVLYVFGLMGLLFLFAGYFVVYQPVDQIRNYVFVVYTAMTPLFIVLAALLGAFSIPADVVKQTIHTIVTKPVERFEIVLGRFLGYAVLLTGMMAILTLISMGYVIRGVNEEAAKESYTARVPVFANNLSFYGVKGETTTARGESVGREWNYRSYIRARRTGATEAKQYAIWSFDSLPGELANRSKSLPFEFTFDIFRTTKGKEGQNVSCVITFVQGKHAVMANGQIGVPSDLEKRIEKFRSDRNSKISLLNNSLSIAKALLMQELNNSLKSGAESVLSSIYTDWKSEEDQLEAEKQAIKDKYKSEREKMEEKPEKEKTKLLEELKTAELSDLAKLKTDILTRLAERYSLAGTEPNSEASGVVDVLQQQSVLAKSQIKEAQAVLKPFREALAENNNPVDVEKKLRKELEQQIVEKLVSKHGVFQDTVRVADYHTESVKVPVSLFKKIQEDGTMNGFPIQIPGETSPTIIPAMLVCVAVDELDQGSRDQLLGVARRDIYLLQAELPFWQNFLKCSFGLWCKTILVLAIAVSCSTYLNGLISLLCASFLYLTGLLVDFVRNIAEGRNAGGGPVESLTRLVNKLPPAAQLSESASGTVNLFDAAYLGFLQQVLKLIPEVNRYNLTDYLANGFDISWGQVLLLDNFLPLLGYLVPWAILSYYLMNSREVANPR